MMSINDEIVLQLRALGRVLINEPMKYHTTFKTGGTADLFIYPGNVLSLAGVVRLCVKHSIPLTVIGGGSNLLVGDKGIRGITVCMCENQEQKGRLNMEPGGGLYADSIVKKDEFIEFCLKQELEGMEFMAGIPGCIGGGIIMNAGTNMGNFSGILEYVDYIDGEGELKKQKISGEMAHYRRMDLPPDTIVTGGYFRLKSSNDITPVRERIRRILEERSAKHPLNFPSAGSVFKNPEGYSSWKLIDDAGLKGHRIGGAMVSKLHTNFIINFENAKSLDILNLIEYIKNRVHTEFGVSLSAEIRQLGEF